MAGAVFAPALFGEGVLDDYSHILHNPLIRHLSNFPALLFSSVVDSGGAEAAPSFYRPLPFLSWGIGRALFGPGLLGQHLINLLLHAANGWLVFALVGRLIGGGLPALLAGAIFTLHPLQVEGVAWATGRVDLLLTCFLLLAGWFWLRPGRSNAWWSGFFYFLALLSKETAILFLLSLPALWFLPKELWPFSERKPRAYATLAATAIYLACRRWAVAPGAFFWPSLWPGFVPWMNLCGGGIELFVRGGPPDFSRLLPVAAGRTAVGVAWLLSTAISARFAIRRPPWRAVLVGAAGYLLCCYPLALYLRQQAAVADRHFYPLLFFLILAWVGAAWAIPWPRWRWLRGGLMAAVALWLGYGAAVSAQRSWVWLSEEAIYRSSLARHPDNLFPRYFLALRASRRQEVEAAIAEYRRIVAVDAHFLYARSNLAALLLQRRHYGEAARYLREELALAPDSVRDWKNLAAAYQGLGDFSRCARVWERVLQWSAPALRSLFPMAVCQMESGAWIQSRDNLRRLLAMAPRHFPAWLQLARVEAYLGDKAAARQALQEADAISPNDPLSLRELVLAWQRLPGAGATACECARRGLDLAGDKALRSFFLAARRRCPK